MDYCQRTSEHVLLLWWRLRRRSDTATPGYVSDNIVAAAEFKIGSFGKVVLDDEDNTTSFVEDFLPLCIRCVIFLCCDLWRYMRTSLSTWQQHAIDSIHSMNRTMEQRHLWLRTIVLWPGGGFLLQRTWARLRAQLAYVWKQNGPIERQPQGMFSCV